MTKRVDLFDSTYSNFTKQVLADIRKETFGEDIGQNSWLTVDEYTRFISWLEISAGHHLLEVACGSGGPAQYIVDKTGCYLTGIDVNENGIAAAVKNALNSNLSDHINFKLADAGKPLPYEENIFDALICIDSMNHFPDRSSVLREWHRVLRPKGRALFTDPVVITGQVSNDELAARSSIGFFLFVPQGLNEKLIEEAGLHLIKKEDVTENAALVSGRWLQARQHYKEMLVQIEGEERFKGLQDFFAMVNRLTTERRLSRIVYLVEKH